MNIYHYENLDFLDINTFFNLKVDDFVVLVNAGCITSTPKNLPRNGYYKAVVLKNNKAILEERRFTEVGMTPNKAYLIGIEEILSKLRPSTKCKVIVPVALGFCKAEKYKGINVNYIINIKRLELGKKLDISIVEVENSSESMKKMYNDILLGTSEYNVIAMINNKNN